MQVVPEGLHGAIIDGELSVAVGTLVDQECADVLGLGSAELVNDGF